MKIYYNANLDEIQLEEEARQSAIDDVERYETHLDVLNSYSVSEVWDMLTEENQKILYEQAITEELETDNYTCREIEI